MVDRLIAQVHCLTIFLFFFKLLAVEERRNFFFSFFSNGSKNLSFVSLLRIRASSRPFFPPGLRR